jgi:signal transduction histidine kinase
VGNALQHTEHGFIRIAYRAPCLTVADSGSGIAPEHLPRLFDRYYRAAGKLGGMGLGLAIVKQVCEQNGWHIDAASTLGSGSIFTITLA